MDLQTESSFGLCRNRRYSGRRLTILGLRAAVGNGVERTLVDMETKGEMVIIYVSGHHEHADE